MREMKTLEVDKWAPSDKPGMVKHAGMISPQEAFEQLKKHLESVGLLPEEYFHANDSCWNANGFERELPDYMQAECFVNWGGSEGIYLDICLLFRDENRSLERLPFATGKTLGQSGDDFLRMSRIAAECSMMLNGRGDIVRFYEEEKAWGVAQEAPQPEVVQGSLDAVIEEAQNRQRSALSEVVAFLDNVQGNDVDVINFTKKYGLQPEVIRSDSAFLSSIVSEIDRLSMQSPKPQLGSRHALIQVALHNVCLSHHERKQQARLKALMEAKRQKSEPCL